MSEDTSPSPRRDLRAQVLIVEDEPEHAGAMADALRRPGHVCTIVHGVAEALEEFRHGSFDVIVTDLRMPESGGKDGVAADGADAGLRVLQAARTMQPAAETIMVTAHGDVPTARAAFKLGVFDFIQKPLDLEVFRALVEAQDGGMSVEASRQHVAERFGVTLSQVRQVEREGMDNEWPPL